MNNFKKDVTDEHLVTYSELCALLARHPTLPPIEVLAVAANMIGKLVAMQDATRYSPDVLMSIVTQNLMAGNAQMVEEMGGPIHNPKGNA